MSSPLTIEALSSASVEVPSGIIRRHKLIGGSCVCPTASGAPRVIRLFDAFEMETVEATGSAKGAPPTLPAVTDVDSNRVFIDGERAVTNAVMTNGKEHRWYASVFYTYVLVSNEGINSEMPGAKLAEDLSLTVDRANTQLPNVNYPAAMFVTGMLGQPPT